MEIAVNSPDSAKSRRPAEHSSFQRFSFQHFSFTQIPLFPRNPLFPASGLATGSLNGLNPKSKFLAIIKLEKLPNNVEVVTGKAPPLEDGPPRQAFLRARCAMKKFPYLMRYRFDPVIGCYQPVKAHRLNEEDAKAASQGRLPDIPSQLLNGATACPWCDCLGAGSCGNCGTIFCSDQNDSTDTICPGCGHVLKRDPRGSEGNGFNVRQSGG